MMFVSVIAIAVAANRAEDTSWPRRFASTDRGPASIAGKKEHTLLQKDILRHTHKIRGPLVVDIELVGERPTQPGDVFVLKGLVTSESAINNVEYKWVVPQGVEVINGQLNSTIAVMSEGKPFETQITLRQVSDMNVRVHLRARSATGTTRFGDTAQFNSMDQVKIEASRKELKKSVEDYVEKQKQLKVFH